MADTSKRDTDKPPIDPFHAIFSVDDHVVEAPTIWTDRLPARYREIAPRVVREKGRVRHHGGVIEYAQDDVEGRFCDIWYYEGLRVPITRSICSVGFDEEDIGMFPVTFDEMRPGCYDPGRRLQDMDTAGIERSLCFPNTFVRFCGQTFAEAQDKDLALLCVQAYNDWIIDEWCEDSGGRLLPLCIVPLWDVQLAADEVGRLVDRGCHAITFSEIPPYLGLPSIHSGYWDRLFETCAEAGTVLNMHIGSGSKFLTTSDDAPTGAMTSLSFTNAAMALTDWLFSGILPRLPKLRLSFAECQIGWIPYVLERNDTVWEKHRNWNELSGKVPDPPSSYFKEQVLVCFFDDPHGVGSIEEVGVRNVAFEMDYPHADSTWPMTSDVAQSQLGGVDADTARLVLRDNALQFFGCP